MFRIAYILLLLFHQNLDGQVQTFKVRKACEFKLQVDANLRGSTVVLSKFMFEGISKKEAEDIRQELKFIRGKKLLVNEEYFISSLEKACDRKKYKLSIVRLVKTDEMPFVDTTGVVRPFVNLSLIYKEKPDE